MRTKTKWHLPVLTTALIILAAGCGGSDESTATTTIPSAPAASTSTAATVSTTTPPATTTTVPATTTTETVADEPAIAIEGDVVNLSWANLPSTPYFAPAGVGSDPFFHIHTNPASDGFMLSFELYTTGYGSQWTGELGTFDISCADPVNSTGICPYFDSDGPGPIEILGTDFGATGTLTILQLDSDGYEIVVHELIFTNGTTFAEFTMSG